jgi:D-alanyl-D-alanine carboxypeptidase
MFLAVGAVILFGAPAAAGKSALRPSLRADLNRYLSARRVPEHISAVGLTVTFRGSRPGVNIAVGSTRYVGGRPISPSALWQIGSNTKAFTSVMLLQLEAEHKLSINDRLGKWLPQYRAWRRITIKQLLNMTAGIQDYYIQPAFEAAYAAAPNRVFTLSQLVSYAVGLPLKPGWVYSNTNYVLAQMIIERATHDSYGDQLRRRIARPLGLRNLFFSATRYPNRVLARLPAGYCFISPAAVPQLSSQFGQDQSRHTASTNSTPGSGGIVSSLPDVARWDRALHSGRELPRKQQRELESLVSETTGKPISRATASDPVGFGLGVGQTNSPAGPLWFYEGQTLGFRVLHVYDPRTGTDVVVGVNSATLGDNDNLSQLSASLYQTLHRAGLA